MTLQVTPELEAIRAKADELGIKYHHRAGEAKIQELIDAHSADEVQEDKQPQFAHPVNKDHINEEGKIVPMTSEQFRKKYNPLRKKDLNRLVRCRFSA